MALNGMQKSFLFTTFLVCASLCAGAVSALATTSVLERYAESLNDRERFRALLADFPRASSTSSVDTLRTLKERVGQSTVSLVVDGEEQGIGVVVSADGWVMTTRDALLRIGNEDAVLANGRLHVRGESFAIDEVVFDTQTDLVAVRAVGAQGWLPIELADTSELPLPGSMVYAASHAFDIAPVGLRGRLFAYEDEPSPAEAHAEAVLAESVGVGSLLFTSDAKLFGFALDEHEAVAVPAMRPFLKSMLRSTSVAHAGLGAWTIDLSQSPTLLKEVTHGRTAGALVRAPLGERTGILPNGPADHAGIADGDILLAIDDVQITDTVSCADLLVLYAPGQEVRVRIDRSGEVRDMRVTLGTWEELVY